MRLWPFRRRHRRRQLPLQPGEFPPDERQIGADLAQWLPRSGRGYRGSGPQRALADDGSSGSRSSIWPILLALVLAGALAYYAFSRVGVGNLFTGGGALGTVTATSRPAAGGTTATPRTTATRPALVTSTPTPTPISVGG